MGRSSTYVRGACETAGLMLGWMQENSHGAGDP